MFLPDVVIPGWDVRHIYGLLFYTQPPHPPKIFPALT